MLANILALVPIYIGPYMCGQTNAGECGAILGPIRCGELINSSSFPNHQGEVHGCSSKTHRVPGSENG